MQIPFQVSEEEDAPQSRCDLGSSSLHLQSQVRGNPIIAGEILSREDKLELNISLANADPRGGSVGQIYDVVVLDGNIETEAITFWVRVDQDRLFIKEPYSFAFVSELPVVQLHPELQVDGVVKDEFLRE